jgi:TusA-related sulfurtransferase
MPIAKTKEVMDEINIGEILKVEADDPAAETDLKAWAKRTGHRIMHIEKENSIITFYIQKMRWKRNST